MHGSPAIRPADYLEKAERHAGRPLACREELAILLRAAGDPAFAADFERVLFLAKFWEGAMGIIRRTGPGADDVRKLTDELSEATSAVSSLIGTLLDAGAPSAAGEYRNRFLSMDAGSLGRLQQLLSDLALLKNYELHGAGR